LQQLDDCCYNVLAGPEETPSDLLVTQIVRK